MQIRHLVWGEKCPFAFFHDAFHEKVRNPIGGVHVVSSATVVPGVFSELQELFNVQVPSL